MGVTPKQLVEAISDWGVEFRPYPFDDRPWFNFTTAGGWDPIGVMEHHTAGSKSLLLEGMNASKVAMLRLLRIGRSDLDGPLCHLAPTFMAKNKRVVYGIGWGNTNHAGAGRAEVARRVRLGTFSGGASGGDSVDGNPLFWGLEHLHPGDGTPWPDELLDAGHRTTCAIMEAQGWSRKSWAGSVCEHREWSSRKPDRSWQGNVHVAIDRLATLTTTPEIDGWVRTGSVQDVVRALRTASENKAAAGRKHQAEFLEEQIKEIRRKFPTLP